MKKSEITTVVAITLMVIAVMIVSIFIPGCSRTNDKPDEEINAQVDENVLDMVLTPCRTEPPVPTFILE